PTSRVLPSAGARATASVPMMPPPPPRFSTITSADRRGASACASSRASMSAGPPAAKGGTILTPSPARAAPPARRPTRSAMSKPARRGIGLLPLIEAEKLRRVVDQHALARALVHGDVGNDIDQAAVVGHARNVGVRPVGPPQDALGGLRGEDARQRHG